MHIYLDIETIPSQHPEALQLIAAGIKPPASYKKADTIAKWEAEEKPAAVLEAYLKTSFDGAMGHIACASIAVDDDEPQMIVRADWKSRGAEVAVLRGLFDRIIDATAAEHRPTFVGHNIIDFDLRFIFQRAIVLGIKPPRCIPFNARPWDDTVFDTMTAWAGRDRVSMDNLCRALGIPGKSNGIDGSKVWQYVQDGRIGEVAEYCAADVERTRAIHRRMTFARAVSC